MGVGLDANGRVVAGKGNSGIRGVLVKNMPPPRVAGSSSLSQVTSPGAMAGDRVDVMVRGEIVDISGLPAGSIIWADGTTGALAAGQAGGAAPASGAGSTAGSKAIGFTVEAGRLVVYVDTGVTT